MAMSAPLSPIYEFGDFRLDPIKRLLWKNGATVPLTSRVFETLLCLVEHHDTVLDKEQLMEAVWPNSVVEENNLTQNIYTLRRLFGESPSSHRFIVTVPGRGYRFVAEVRTKDDNAAEPLLSAHPSVGQMPELPVSQPADSEVIPERRKRLKIFYLLLVVTGMMAVAILGYWIRKSQLSIGSTGSLSATIDPKSIAVLPFDNLSADPENAYFTTGIQEELLSNLAKIADLKVISRTSVNLYKSGTARNAREIGRDLGVAHLVEGSVQRSSDHLRIHAQLIDTRNDSHLWAQTYDRDLTDLFAVQSEIAQAIAAQLNAKLSARERAEISQPATGDLVANDLYQRALVLELQSPQPESLLRAIGLVEEAVERDPQFVSAYCALARMHLTCTNMGYDHTTPHRKLAEVAIQNAAARQPGAGEVHLIRGWYLGMERREYDQARSEFDLARRTLPNNATLYFQIAYIDRRQGRWTEAARNLERAVELDPRNETFLFETAETYRTMGRYAEAGAFAQRALANSPHNDYNARLLPSELKVDQWADLRPLRKELDAIMREEPSAVSEIAYDLLNCAVCGRDAEAAERALAALPSAEVGLGPGLQGPREWYIGYVARVFNRPEQARRAFETTRSALAERVREQPDNAHAWIKLGLVEAALGHKEEAIAAGLRACEILPSSKEALWGVRIQRDLAKIYAWTGEKDLAFQQLATLSGQTGLFSYGELKLDPDWDPLRGDPRFEELVASVAPNAAMAP